MRIYYIGWQSIKGTKVIMIRMMTSKLMKTMVKRKQLPILYHSNKLELLMRILYIIISKRHTSSSSTRHLNETESKAGTIRSNRPRWTSIELDYRIGLTHVGNIWCLWTMLVSAFSFCYWKYLRCMAYVIVFSWTPFYSNRCKMLC